MLTFAESIFKKANLSLRNGDIDEAISKYKELIEREPLFYPVFENLAEALLQKGLKDEALEVFRQLLLVNPDSVVAKFRINQYNEGTLDLQNNFSPEVSIKESVNKVLDTVCIWNYGSITPGIKNWEEKWQTSPGKRILFFAPADYSGSFFRWAESLNRLTNYAVRLVTLQAHEFGYEQDLVFPGVSERAISSLEKIISECDCIHIKDEIGFFEPKQNELNQSNSIPFGVLKHSGKPIVYTLYGGKARRFQFDQYYRDHVNQFDASIAMTADLAFPWINNCYFVPHSIDCKKYKYCWKDNFTVGHSPSSPSRKGTEKFKEVISKTKQTQNIKFDLIENVSYVECLKRKRNISLFYDQAGMQISNNKGKHIIIGWYGNSAVEAMTFGVPTIAHLSTSALANADNLLPQDFIRELPIINVPMIYLDNSVDDFRDILNDYFKQSAEDRKELSIRTRDFVEKFHSYEATSKMLVNIYESF